MSKRHHRVDVEVVQETPDDEIVSIRSPRNVDVFDPSDSQWFRDCLVWATSNGYQLIVSRKARKS